MKRSSWPTLTKITEVIAQPSSFLSDTELKKAKPALNRFGLPLTWAGQFAIVYKMISGNKCWAARCFTSRVEDHYERYLALSEAIQKIGKPSCLIDFKYIQKGILILGNWYPLVKMDWIDGETLDTYIENLVLSKNKNGLNQLAKNWLDVMNILHQYKMAHGDLQHANILISKSRIRLVDYDGFYVPKLQGRNSLEIGISHYQHPGRTSKIYNETLDHFSSLVIYLSIIALSADFSLWDKYHEDKNLIFKESDFLNPSQSKLIQKLKNFSNQEIKSLARVLELDCQRNTSNLPDINELVNNNLSPKPRKPVGSKPDWLEGTHRKPQNAKTRAQQSPRQETDKKPDWMLDNENNASSKRTSRTEKKRKLTDKKPDWMLDNENNSSSGQTIKTEKKRKLTDKKPDWMLDNDSN